jgi:hypothetical protein
MKSQENTTFLSGNSSIGFEEQDCLVGRAVGDD